MSAESLILFFIVGAFLVGIALLFFPVTFHPLLPIRRNQKPTNADSTEGLSWLQFNVGYYLFAIIFLVFDVETVFIFPWAKVMKETGMMGFVEIVIFFFVLGIGLLYAWKKGALKWE